MSWHIKYWIEAEEDLAELDNFRRAMVTKVIDRVSQNPLPQSEGGYGKPLGNKGNVNLTGCYKIKLRDAGIRIVYRLQRTEQRSS